MPADFLDPRAVQILRNAFSSKALEGRTPESVAQDYEYAKKMGVMFDAVHLSHAQIQNRALSAVRAVERRTVANAFVASLSTRRLDLRSAIGSYSTLLHFPEHAPTHVGTRCRICGVCDRDDVEDLNVLLLERLDYGGVRHDQPLYAALDLEFFARLPKFSPSQENLHLLRALLRTIEEVPARTTSAQLQKLLPRDVKSNKNERDVLVGILGLCGILQTREHQGYLRGYVPEFERHLPDRRFTDMAYPAVWWIGSDGVNREAVAYWFGHLLDTTHDA